jgi:hypothetical protein
VIAVVGALAIWNDATRVAPWAYGKGPLLTGNWVGHIQTPAGQTGTLELMITRYFNASQSHTNTRHANVTGRAAISAFAQVCGITFATEHIDLTGSATSKGDDVALRADGADVKEAGIGMKHLQGAWSGDSLRLTTVFYTPKHRPDTTTIVLVHDTPAAFLAACQRTSAAPQ